MMDTIKIMVDPDTGKVTVDAHNSKGGHIKGSEKFTEDLGNALGDIDERHKGQHRHEHNKDREVIKST